jgi:hypothetical protein
LSIFQEIGCRTEKNSGLEEAVYSVKMNHLSSFTEHADAGMLNGLALLFTPPVERAIHASGLNILAY